MKGAEQNRHRLRVLRSTAGKQELADDERQHRRAAADARALRAYAKERLLEMPGDELVRGAYEMQHLDDLPSVGDRRAGGYSDRDGDGGDHQRKQQEDKQRQRAS